MAANAQHVVNHVMMHLVITRVMKMEPGSAMLGGRDLSVTNPFAGRDVILQTGNAMLQANARM